MTLPFILIKRLGSCDSTGNDISSLTKVFDEIRISIDGFEEMNDKLRGQGSFKKAMNAFQKV